MPVDSSGFKFGLLLVAVLIALVLGLVFYKSKFNARGVDDDDEKEDGLTASGVAAALS